MPGPNDPSDPSRNDPADTTPAPDTVDHVAKGDPALHTTDFSVDPVAEPPVSAATASFHPPPAPRKKKSVPRNVQLPGYEVQGELGRGAMGVVYQARQVKADRLVALKLMLGAEHAGSQARERFDREAQAVARLQHPNIVQVFEVGELNDLPYFT